MDDRKSTELERHLMEIAQELKLLADQTKQPALKVSVKRAGVLIEALADQARRYNQQAF